MMGGLFSLFTKSNENEPDETTSLEERRDVASKDTSTKLQKDAKDINETTTSEGRLDSGQDSKVTSTKIQKDVKKSDVVTFKAPEYPIELLSSSKLFKEKYLSLDETSRREETLSRWEEIWKEYAVREKEIIREELSKKEKEDIIESQKRELEYLHKEKEDIIESQKRELEYLHKRREILQMEMLRRRIGIAQLEERDRIQTEMLDIGREIEQLEEKEDIIESQKRELEYLHKTKIDEKELTHWYQLQVLDRTKMLPRYTYHKSLLNWITEGVMNILSPREFTDCHIIIKCDEKQRNELCLTSEMEEIDAKAFPSAAAWGNNGEDVLVVSFVNNDSKRTSKDIELLREHISLKDGTILYVMNNNCLNNEQMKAEMFERAKMCEITDVNFVEESRSEIITKMTCILEKRIVNYLQNIKDKLTKCPRTQAVNASLLEVNAVLNRLKQAECYPDIDSEDAKLIEIETDTGKVDKILKRFEDKILYHGYNDNTLYIIVTEESVKENLENLLMDQQLLIEIKEKLEILELANVGVPLHGTKFVYKNETKEEFHADLSFATTGSLMWTNKNQIVAVTARHAFEKNISNAMYVLIEGNVIRLGGQVEQPQNKMECIEDDIAMIEIDEETRPLVDEKCEKSLIDYEEVATRAQISERILEKGDIVHKRGAKTGLTTGVVTDIKIEAVGRFKKPSRVIYITGRENKPFAEGGDSGSLVYRQSLSPEENILEVLALVQGRVNVPIPNADIICFPFKEGCCTLYKNIEDIEPLKFFDC